MFHPMVEGRMFHPMVEGRMFHPMVDHPMVDHPMVDIQSLMSWLGGSMEYGTL